MEVSPFENLPSFTCDLSIPRFSQILFTKSRWELPAKTTMLFISFDKTYRALLNSSFLDEVQYRFSVQFTSYDRICMIIVPIDLVISVKLL